MKINLKNRFYLFPFFVFVVQAGDTDNEPPYNPSEIGYLLAEPKKILKCSYSTVFFGSANETHDPFETYNPKTPTYKIIWNSGTMLEVVKKSSQETIYKLGIDDGYILNYQVSAFSPNGKSLVISHGGEILPGLVRKRKPYREIVGLSLVKGDAIEKFKIKDTDNFCRRLTAIAVSDDCQKCFVYDDHDKSNLCITCIENGNIFEYFYLSKAIKRFGYQELLNRFVLISKEDKIGLYYLGNHKEEWE